ncbi:DUF805 domain-containing protein [Psychrobacter sp. I-STPA6b]|uniref:DUF805 domain-containing protein n=1 Tax=Psychrobacter sp. I-STPA6b TaxID=2585718 RepID=UPI001D0C997C|nr:DUF805 domain-containing protein [Psychrobacter sp. I-STPA6b]
MKNFLKKKSDTKQPDANAINSGIGGSHKKFMQRVKKNKSKSKEPENNNAQLDNSMNRFDDISSDRVILSDQSNLYNTGTWYSLKGRIGRVQLLAFGMIWGIIFNILLLTALFLSMDALISGTSDIGSLGIGVLVIMILLLPIFIYTSIILPVRRLHDIGKSGWWLLLAFIPLANLLLIYFLYFARGNAGANAYGLPPTPYSKIELFLAVLVPLMLLISVVSVNLLPPEAQQALMPTAEQQQIDIDTVDNVIVAASEDTELNTDVTTEAESVDATDNAEGVDNTEVVSPDTQAMPEATDTEAAPLDPEVAAQVEAAINNATNAEDDSTALSYDDFIRESTTKVFVAEEDAPSQ